MSIPDALGVLTECWRSLVVTSRSAGVGSHGRTEVLARGRCPICSGLLGEPALGLSSWRWRAGFDIIKAMIRLERVGRRRPLGVRSRHAPKIEGVVRAFSIAARPWSYRGGVARDPVYLCRSLRTRATSAGVLFRVHDTLSPPGGRVVLRGAARFAGSVSEISCPAMACRHSRMRR